MHYPDTFELTALGEQSIQVRRDFHAPRQLVFDAFTQPELVSRWLLGPPGWSMPVCEIDLRVGGVYRYLWRHAAERQEMGIRGEFREVTPPARLVMTERFDAAWYPGEALNTTVFVQDGAITRVTITLLYESPAARDMARRSGMEQGMAMGFLQLEQLLLAGA